MKHSIVSHEIPAGILTLTAVGNPVFLLLVSYTGSGTCCCAYQHSKTKGLQQPVLHISPVESLFLVQLPQFCSVLV